MIWEGVDWPEGWSYRRSEHQHSFYDCSISFRQEPLFMDVLLMRRARIYRAILHNVDYPDRDYVTEVGTAEEALAECVKFILTEGV